MKHYAIERQLAHPLVEYARYVLSKGSDEEKRNLATGIINEMAVKNDTMTLVSN